MPFFSVIIPLYNKEKYIEATINSVLEQTFTGYEIIIINDGSTDRSCKIAKSISDSRIQIYTQENSGVSIARNVGIKKANSKYIALLDADDLWYDNHLLELKKQIILFPNAGLYCNNYEIFLKKNISRKAKFNFHYDKDCVIIKDYFKASIIDSVAWTSAIGFSKEKFNAIGKFNIIYKTAQDLDLWIRFALHFKVSFNPTITMAYKLYIGSSLSKNEYNNIRYNFTANYYNEERLNTSLKMYLDKKRYGLALRCKINNEKLIYNKTIKDIDLKNLNFKQRNLLRLPCIVLKQLNKLRDLAQNSNFYLKNFKR